MGSLSSRRSLQGFIQAFVLQSIVIADLRGKRTGRPGRFFVHAPHHDAGVVVQLGYHLS